MGHPDQGIVHVIGPELGLTQLVKPLFVATLIHRHTVPLVPLHLVLVHQRWSMYYRRKLYGKISQRRWKFVSKGSYQLG